MKLFNKITQSGFTLVEMIVSLALFSTVIVISIGALLILVATNEQLQGEQSVMTNLSFALDSMTREIRTGTHYYCDQSSNYSSGGFSNIFEVGNNMDTILNEDKQDCFEGKTNASHHLQGVAFIEGGDSITGANNRILYFYDSDLRQLFRKIGAEEKQLIVSSGIVITRAEFFVTGSEALIDDSTALDQPSVTIVIEAQEADDSTKTYELQTTVTQRILDL